LADLVERDASGDIIVSLGAVLGIRGITCSGSASLDVMGVGAKADPFQAAMNVQNLAPKIIGKIAPKDGKTCLRVSDVELEIRRDMVSWKDIQVNFANAPLQIPTSFTEKAWDNLPIDGLISSMNSMIVETLKTQLNNMGAEQCFALSPTVALTQSPTVIPTAAPTLISTGAPTPSPTVPTPSPTTMDIASLTSSLMAMVQSDPFLARINGLIVDQLPEKMNLEFIEYSDKMELSLFHVNYKAQLLECTGLNTLAITEFGQGLADLVERDASGDIIVSLGAVLGIRGITCSGSASLDVMGVGAKADPFQAAMNVQNLAPKIIGKIAPKDGKTCLRVSDVELEIRRDMVSWKDIQLNFGPDAFDASGRTLIPNSVTDLLWDNLPINSLISTMNSMVVETLKTQLNNMGAEQCF